MRFCGLQLEDNVPDHNVVCRFRKVLSASGVWEVLLQQINTQLSRHGVLVKQGAMIDASVTPTPRKPKSKTSYTIHAEGQGTHRAYCTARRGPAGILGSEE